MNKFDKTYNKIIMQYVDQNIIEQGFFDKVTNFFKKKDKDDQDSASVKSSYCKKLWNDKNYDELATELQKYKKENREEFGKDKEAIFYYGVMMLKDLISESKLQFTNKSLLLESTAVQTDQEEKDIVQLDVDKKHLRGIKKKAKKGDKDAIYDLAVCYYLGIPDVLNQNMQKAIKYFKIAAKKGCAEAQYNLGVMYEKGYDSKDEKHDNEFENYINKDQDIAFKYYAKALQNGYEDAREPYEYLLNKKKNESKSKNNSMGEFTNSVKKIERGLQYIQIAAKAGLEEAKAFLQKHEQDLKNKISTFVQLKDKEIEANTGIKKRDLQLELGLA